MYGPHNSYDAEGSKIPFDLLHSTLSSLLAELFAASSLYSTDNAVCSCTILQLLSLY